MLCNFRIYWSALLLDWILYRCILLLSSEQLENNCFSMLCRTCKCWQYFIVKYFKIVFMTITTRLLREVFSCWEGSSSWWWIQVFQKFWFSFECSNCTISYKCCQHFSWCDRLTSFIFDKPVAKYSNVNKHSFGNEKWLSFHEKQNSLFSLYLKRFTGSFSLRQPQYFGTPTHFTVLALSSHRTLKDVWSGIETNISSRMSLVELAFVHCECRLVKRTVAAAWPTKVFAPWVQMSAEWGRL